ncbi:UNVERIFIED_CONTAM: hypothetical protein FKN15_018870 [Acipenser sinensis]
MPGSAHDAALFRSSGLYTRQHALPQAIQHIGDQGVPLSLVGDAASPLLPWLMKSYPSGHLTAVEEAFSTMLGRVRVVVEQALEREVVDTAETILLPQLPHPWNLNRCVRSPVQLEEVMAVDCVALVERSESNKIKSSTITLN